MSPRSPKQRSLLHWLTVAVGLAILVVVLVWIQAANRDEPKKAAPPAVSTEAAS